MDGEVKRRKWLVLCGALAGSAPESAFGFLIFGKWGYALDSGSYYM